MSVRPGALASICAGICASALFLPTPAGVTTQSTAHRGVTGWKAPIRGVRRLPITAVVTVVSGARGLYVLRRAPYPGDPSGNGWEVELVDPDSGQVLGSVAGDAAPVAMVSAFGSLWVLTGAGAMPGGLGPGLDRIDPLTLRRQATIPLPHLAPYFVAASRSTLWLASANEVAAFDPCTDTVRKTVDLGSSYLVGALASIGGEAVVAGDLFPAPGSGGSEKVTVVWLDADTLRVASRVTLGHGFADDQPSSIAPTSTRTLLLGLFRPTPYADSAAVLHGDTALGPRRGVGADVLAADGNVWAAYATGPTSTHGIEIQRLSSSGEVGATLKLPAGVTVRAASGPDLFASTGRSLVELR